MVVHRLEVLRFNTMRQLDGVAAGTYVVAVTAGEECHVQRLVVQP